MTYKEILYKIFRAWQIQEQDPKKVTYECFLEACNGDQDEAQLLELFAHWDNDLIGMAPHFGIALVCADGKPMVIMNEVPPKPSIEHLWSLDTNDWFLPEPQDLDCVPSPI